MMTMIAMKKIRMMMRMKMVKISVILLKMMMMMVIAMKKIIMMLIIATTKILMMVMKMNLAKLSLHCHHPLFCLCSIDWSFKVCFSNIYSCFPIYRTQVYFAPSFHINLTGPGQLDSGMEENLEEILSEENSGGPLLPSGEEAYLVMIILILRIVAKVLILP